MQSSNAAESGGFLRTLPGLDRPDVQYTFMVGMKENAKTKEARRILAMPAMAKYLGDELSPGGGTVGDDRIEAYVRQAATTTYHPVGTCKMGLPTTRWRWWTPSCACTASKACAWPTRRSCPTSLFLLHPDVTKLPDAVHRAQAFKLPA